MTEKNESSFDSESDLKLDHLCQFSSDKSSTILTSEQLEVEKNHVRNYLQESGALSMKPTLTLPQVRELLLRFHNGWFTMKDIEVNQIMQCYIQRESTATYWNVLVTRNELRYIGELQEGAYINAVDEIKCTVCFSRGFIGGVNDTCYRCKQCLVVKRVGLAFFWGSEISCETCSHCQILTEQTVEKNCAVCTTCEGEGFLKKIEFERLSLVLNGNIPVVDKDDEKYGTLLSLFKKAEAKILVKRQGKTEFKNVYEEYMAYKSSISNVAVTVVECLIQSKKRRFWIIGEDFQIMQGCDNPDATESSGKGI